MMTKIHLLTMLSIINLFNTSNTYAINWFNPSKDYTNEMYTIYNPGHYNKVPNNKPIAQQNHYINITSNIPVNNQNHCNKITNNIPVVNQPPYSNIANIHTINHNHNMIKQADQYEVDKLINDFLSGNTTPTTDYYINSKKTNSNNILNNRKFSYDVSDTLKINNLKYQTNTYHNTAKPRAVTAGANNREMNNQQKNVIRPKVTKVYKNSDDMLKQILISNANPDGKIKSRNNNLVIDDDANPFNPQFAKTGNNFFHKLNINNENNIQIQQHNNIPNYNNPITQKQNSDSKTPINLEDIPLSVTKYIKYDTPEYNTCITDVETNTNQINEVRKIVDEQKNNIMQDYNSPIAKSPITLNKKNNIKKIEIINTKANNIIHKTNPHFNTGISTGWENDLTPDDVTSFLENIKESLAYENMRIQTYSLLGGVAPGFGDSDEVRLFFDVIKNNRDNRNELHIYNYEKPLALAGIFTDYYLNNVQLYNNDRNKFNIGRTEFAKKSLSFDNNEYSQAVKILSLNNFYEVVNKIVKGINILAKFKQDRKENDLIPIQCNISKSNKQDWLVSTFQLFDYALQYSNKNDKLANTTFAKFADYLKNNSQHRNINEEVQFIPTLKSFIKQNPEQFNDKSIQSALEALYKEEDKDIGCCGIMGSILMFRIFPELQTIFSSNQFSTHDSIIARATKFYFSTNLSLAQQFSAQAHNLLDITKSDNSKKLFNNTDYLIMITNGLTRDKVIDDRNYISSYTEIDSKNNDWRLALYELMGVQLCADDNINNYISIDKSKLGDTINPQSKLGKECVNKCLKPIQALYKRISQTDYNKYMDKKLK